MVTRGISWMFRDAFGGFSLLSNYFDGKRRHKQSGSCVMVLWMYVYRGSQKIESLRKEKGGKRNEMKRDRQAGVSKEYFWKDI